MQNNRSKVLETELVFEGGKVDDPHDPGGRTNQGITQRVYSAYRVNRGLAPQDVYIMSDDERDEIYVRQYLAPVHFDELPPGLDAIQADGSINSGPVQAIKWLQRALGSLYTGKVDGSMGVATLAAVKATSDLEGLIQRVVERRMAFLKANKNWRYYGKGWTRRVEQIQKIAVAMALGSEHPKPVFVEHGNQKATLHTAEKLTSPAPATGVGSVGATTVVLTSYVGQIRDQIKPVLATVSGGLSHDLLAGAVHYLDNASTWMTSAGGLGAVLGAGWAAYAAHRNARLRDALDVRGTVEGQPAPAVAS